ncbi:GntR family transcriptional regulator [Pseudoclavibacter sp. CFCC 13611]|uniref:UTRA domain-containing protein n=1 Tax=Pseudoclavibacter sp. CFCC 13611 TaxID=2615178 RepID=UPI001300F482|nr:GntR family transcriptional regulator [Pseudoclavibacter sp. CFCC 13611]KAB1664188.1 GntR family transcriptional regulator [Pseudoclavibacter sp. CFCC 13611]
MSRPLALRHAYAILRAAVNSYRFPQHRGNSFSEEEVMHYLQASRTETREALDRLTAEAILKRAPRRGTTVEQRPVAWSLTDGLNAGGRPPVRIEKLQSGLIDATPALQDVFSGALQINTRDEVFFVNDLRICLRTTYWPDGLSERPVILPYNNRRLTESFETSYRRSFGHLESTLTAIAADRRQAHVLDTDIGEPLLWRQTTLYDRANVICELSHSFYLAHSMYFDLVDTQNP